MQRVACPGLHRAALARPQPRRAVLCASRPMLAVRCSAASAAGQPPVPNPILRLAAAASSMLRSAMQRVQSYCAEAARQTDQEVRLRRERRMFTQQHVRCTAGPCNRVGIAPACAGAAHQLRKAVYRAARHPL